MASLMPSIAEIYFALVIDKTTIDCKLTFQLIVKLQRTKIEPDENLHLFGSPT